MARLLKRKGPVGSAAVATLAAPAKDEEEDEEEEGGEELLDGYQEDSEGGDSDQEDDEDGLDLSSDDDEREAGAGEGEDESEDGGEDGVKREGTEEDRDEADVEEDEEDDDDEEEEEEEEEEDESTREIGKAVLDYVRAARANAAADRGEEDGNVGDVAEAELSNGDARENDAGREDVDEGEWRIPSVEESDSSEDERPDRNTVGAVPLEWYKDEEHIGYDRAGAKLIKKEKKDKLDAFLDRADNDKEWRKVYDEYNDEEVVLTKEEIKMIRRIREGKVPHAEVNPYEPYVDWFTWGDKGHPLSSAPEPKRRFIPSKWEAKMVVKLVRALRKGWIKLEKPPEKPKVYLLWGDDLKTAEKTPNGLAYIPPPKPKLPGHEESYNPPVEYIPSEEEVKSYDLMYEEDRPKFIPKAFDSLRKVPAYKEFIKERFERCLDLYLCPRTRKKRINIDPESLIPKLPKPKSLQPFPTTPYLEYRGHTAAVCSVAPDPTGQWLASGSQDGSVRLWEVQTGRCRRTWHLGGRVRQVAWNPAVHLAVLAVAVDKDILLLPMETGSEEDQSAVAELLSVKKGQPTSELVTWGGHQTTSGLAITHEHTVHSVSWHYKGDYFTSVAPDGNTRSVLVHQLSRRATQNPFRKNHGRVACVLFHPQRPFLLVATRTHIRCYNLAKQQLAKKLTAGVNHISSLAVHPGGDNLVIGSQDMRVAWFDMDLSTKPYRTLRNHGSGVTSVAFHRSYPLFASSSDDGTAHVFHGMVYSDLLQNPLIVPVKILRGHATVNKLGVLDCAFHPTQPWLFTAGADNVIKLFCH